MSEQKALYLQTAPNGEWVVRPRSVPKPGPGDILVKIHSAGLNPLDWKVRAYNFGVEKFPALLGAESAGTVEQVGEGVTKFKEGDRVIHQGSYYNDDLGTYQQYATVPADIAAKLPSAISFDQGASIPVGAFTAVNALYGDRSQSGAHQYIAPYEEGGNGKYSGKPIVIFGGSTVVGLYTIQFARLSGFSPIITTASLHNEAYLRSLGATHVIDRNTDVVSVIAKFAGEPIELVVDAVSEKDTQEQALSVVAPNGAVILVLPPQVDLSKYNNKHVVSIRTDSHVATKPLALKLYNKLTKLLEDGLIKPVRVEALAGGLEGIPVGLQRLQENKVSALKLIAHPQETI